MARPTRFGFIAPVGRGSSLTARNRRRRSYTPVIDFKLSTIESWLMNLAHDMQVRVVADYLLGAK
jgi:hypothetical protein